MGKFALTMGGHIETTTPHELHRALLDQDARLMADVSGVKQGELFIQSAQIAGAQSYTVPANEGPSSGFVWAVMSVGIELSTASQARIYKGQPFFNGPATIVPSGNGRFVAQCANFITTGAQFSKGQFTLKGGDTWTVVMVTAGSILSIFASYIEVPILQQGKLWL